MLSLCEPLCISNSCFTKHARGNRSLALSNISRSLQRFLMVHTKQHRFVESFKRSDIQLRIISIHCDVLPKNVCLAFWQKWKQNGSRNTMLLHWSDYSYYGKPYKKKIYCPNVVSYLSYISGNIRLSFFYENKLNIN